MEYKVYKIGEISKLSSGGDCPKNFSKTPTNVYNIPVFSNGIDNKGLHGYTDKPKIYEESLTLSARGTIGYAFLRTEPYVPIVRLISIFPNPEIIDIKYFLYYLNMVRLEGFGTSQQQITLPYLAKKKIQIIKDVNTQRAIANVLCKYDKCIEYNNKKISILKEISYKIFEEWFIRFRYPHSDLEDRKETNLGKIPNSFEITKAKYVIKDYIGGGWGNDDIDNVFNEDAYVIRGADFPSVSDGDISTCPLRYHKKSNYNQRQLNKNDIIIEISGGTEEQPVGRTLLITEGLLEKFKHKAICASFCKRLKINDEVVDPVFFKFWMEFLYRKNIIDRFQLQSTGISNFKFEYFLNKCDVLLPDRKLSKEFSRIVTDINEQIDSIASKNILLEKKKNLLLPRLMSGQIELK